MSEQNVSGEPQSITVMSPDEQRAPEKQPRAGLIKFIERISTGEVPRYEHSRTFVFPFVVGEERLIKLNDIIADEFKRVLPNHILDFGSETRFKDLSTLRFDTFNEFLANAGERKNPERVSLLWRKMSVDFMGTVESGKVELQFTTEQETPVEKLVVDKVILATIILFVSGSDRAWTENVYSKLEPYIESTQLSDVYKPLWVFRNKFVVQIVSLVSAWGGLYTAMHFADLLFGIAARTTHLDVLASILASSNPGTKLDILAKYFLTPDKSPWYDPFRSFLFGAAAYVAVYICGMHFLPKLTPSSHIAIGLSKYRAENAQNIYRLVVGAGFVGLLLEPLLRYIIGIAAKLLSK